MGKGITCRTRAIEQEELRVLLKSIDTNKELSIIDYINLKRVLSSVNNTITTCVTRLFIEKYLNSVPKFKDKTEEIISRFMNTAANTNGYDIESDDLKIIVEVKCNIPVNKESFGPAQVDGIEKDLIGLAYPKNKTKSSHENKSDYEDYLKFMVFLDTPGVDEFGLITNPNKTRHAVKKIIDKWNSVHKDEPKSRCVLIDDAGFNPEELIACERNISGELICRNIYVVLIKME